MPQKRHPLFNTRTHNGRKQQGLKLEVGDEHGFACSTFIKASDEKNHLEKHRTLPRCACIAPKVAHCATLILKLPSAVVLPHIIIRLYSAPTPSFAPHLCPPPLENPPVATSPLWFSVCSHRPARLPTCPSCCLARNNRRCHQGGSPRDPGGKHRELQRSPTPTLDPSLHPVRSSSCNAPAAPTHTAQPTSTQPSPRGHHPRLKCCSPLRNFPPRHSASSPSQSPPI